MNLLSIFSIKIVISFFFARIFLLILFKKFERNFLTSQRLRHFDGNDHQHVS